MKRNIIVKSKNFVSLFWVVKTGVALAFAFSFSVPGLSLAESSLETSMNMDKVEKIAAPAEALDSKGPTGQNAAKAQGEASVSEMKEQAKSKVNTRAKNHDRTHHRIERLPDMHRIKK
jgi:hypothetical protein